MKLFYVGEKLCTLSKGDDGRPMFEVITRTPSVTIQPQINYGDINLDGDINAIDLAYLRAYLLGMKGYIIEEDNLIAADVDGNGSVNSIDFAYLKRYLLCMISKFPVEQYINLS